MPLVSCACMLLRMLHLGRGMAAAAWSTTPPAPQRHPSSHRAGRIAQAQRLWHGQVIVGVVAELPMKACEQ